MQEQLIAVFVGVVAEPLIRWIKAKFALTGSAMLLATIAIAALGAVLIVGYDFIQSGEPITLDAVLALAPTIFAVGQVIYALL